MASTTDGHRTLEAIKYSQGKLSILDQLALPHETKYVSVCVSITSQHIDSCRLHLQKMDFKLYDR
jgi:hypothetical protein